MAGKPGRSGGARPGAGRKPTRAQFAKEVASLEAAIADGLPDVKDNLFLLADGKAQRIEERWVTAGSQLIDGPLTYKNGEPMLSPRGQALMGKKPAYPDKKPDELVLVERKITTEPPSAVVNMYLADRVAGRPVTPPDETDMIPPEDVASLLQEMRESLEAIVQDPAQREEFAAKLIELAARYSGADKDEGDSTDGTAPVPGVSGGV